MVNTQNRGIVEFSCSISVVFLKLTITILYRLLMKPARQFDEFSVLVNVVIRVVTTCNVLLQIVA